ncbi:YveK family protein [Limosilactobacillus pontis]|uniref:YveK family protein n=1 Tax=Limosilactobacillus pontis TaxID=35787 RepID=UPI00071038E7|nr:Wzz/FepE/Etk N-terminal domain-containing protein [Limosilactobacillus pontis]QFV01137.1 exopolysaccharide biosynthesis protein [Limosilactobacillus pontis]
MNNSSETLNNTIDLSRLMAILRKHFKMLIVWTLLAGVLGFVVAQFVVVPKYTATTEILVNQKRSNDNNGQAYNNQQADIQMINTYKDLITNQVVLNKVSHQLNSAKVVREYGRSYNMPVSELKDAISINTQQNSQVFSVAVKTDDPNLSAATANTIAQVFKKQIKKIMSVNNVTIVSRAAAPDSPSFPNVKLFTLAGAVLGLLLSAIYLIIKELMDTTIKDDDFMTKELGLTNLGHIKHFHLSHAFKANQVRREDNTQAERRV